MDGDLRRQVVTGVAYLATVAYWAGFRGGPLPEEAWALAVLAIGVAIAAAVLSRTDDWAYGLVFIWAYVGIAVKQDAPIVVAAALLGSALVGVLIGDLIRRGRSMGPGRSASALPTTLLPT